MATDNTATSSSGSRSAHRDPLIFLPRSTHKYTLILLHGRGSNGEKFGAEFMDTGISSAGLKLAETLPNAKLIFPTAKKRRSRVFGRSTINQWMDIASLEDPSLKCEQQIEGLTESAGYIQSIINHALETISRENIILGGLSQGCAAGLSTLLGLDFSLGGFVGMSGWLPFNKDYSDILNEVEESEDENPFSADEWDEGVEEDGKVDMSIAVVNFAREEVLSKSKLDAKASSSEHTCLATPIFLGHGKLDEKVNVKLGEEAASTFRSLGMDVTWKCYLDLGHWYKVPDEIDDILVFISERVGWVLSSEAE